MTKAVETILRLPVYCPGGKGIPPHHIAKVKKMYNIQDDESEDESDEEEESDSEDEEEDEEL